MSYDELPPTKSKNKAKAERRAKRHPRGNLKPQKPGRGTNARPVPPRTGIKGEAE